MYFQRSSGWTGPLCPSRGLCGSSRDGEDIHTAEVDMSGEGEGEGDSKQFGSCATATESGTRGGAARSCDLGVDTEGVLVPGKS
jgi:hypothetical protein